ncbi:MAG: DUF2267 domain-containing protein [Oscillatoriophycideae cyanobacterium NC_groundwater_1537_Pr4_S-0.65um_50_18]|nr:DUF2267 domain-containing protein [Oscillatoriophycideae cyanobacterium NC_groundwater_1537_Pr4_S-0.65um_50_18]
MLDETYNANSVNDATEVTNTREVPSGQHRSFLEKVMAQGKLADLYDARDITEVVFRTMRDLMTNEAVDHVAEDLHAPLVENNDDKTIYTATPLATEVEDLWQDTNPLVHFLSRIRPTLKIEDKTFLFRVQQEAGLPAHVKAEDMVGAVFSATKAELPSERIQEIAQFLPGTVRQIWENA